MGDWLKEFTDVVIQQNAGYFQWMEVVIDFIIKICFRNKHILNWFNNN